MVFNEISRGGERARFLFFSLPLLPFPFPFWQLGQCSSGTDIRETAFNGAACPSCHKVNQKEAEDPPFSYGGRNAMGKGMGGNWKHS